LNRVLKVFGIKLRAPHRGTSLGPFVCGASGVIGKSTKFGFEWKWPLMGQK